MSEIYNEFWYQSNLGRRPHVDDYNRLNPMTYGSYCPYCGFRLFYDHNNGYYCNCNGWKHKSYDYVEPDWVI